MIAPLKTCLALILVVPAISGASSPHVLHGPLPVETHAPGATADADPLVRIRGSNHNSTLTRAAFADWKNRHPGIIARVMPTGGSPIVETSAARRQQARDDFADADSDQDRAVSGPELARLIARRDAAKIAALRVDDERDIARTRLRVARWVDNHRVAL